MIHTQRAYRGMVVAPHHLASNAGLRVLQEGGNAVEAMLAAASTIAVVYPHMNGLGGDNFWLMHKPSANVHAIDACGGAAAMADIEFYRSNSCSVIPERGALAALTMAGAVAGWQAAYEYSRTQLGGRLPLSRLLEDAIYYARDGVAVTRTLATNLALKLEQIAELPGIADVYLPDGKPCVEGMRLRQAKLADTLQHLTHVGLDDFYRGELGRAMAVDLERLGSPLRLSDFERYQPLSPSPLSLAVSGHTVFNMPPPTQGLASLILLGVYDRLQAQNTDTFEYVHTLIEASKCAFRVRDREVCDPDYMRGPVDAYLQNHSLEQMAQSITAERAAPWPDAANAGDTVWLGAIDAAGNAVSFIQSLYWEFGSGVILPESGITWQNRGISFDLDPNHYNSLQPLRRPFHTIQPALARLADGRVMVYGTMGGEGQPQTQAMIFSRHVLHGESLQHSITAPRWLLGRTWGSAATNLRIENRFPETLYTQLRAAGHDVEIVGSFEEFMGHAGAIVSHPDGLLEAAADPRSDGIASGF